MKRLILLALVVPLLVWLANAGEHNGSRNSTVTTNNEPSSDDCRDHLRVYNDDFRASVRDEETRTLAMQPLSITAAHNGGIQVSTWDKPEISIKLCKQAAADDEAGARKALADTRLEINGSRISVHAPESDHGFSLGTLLLVKTPKGGELELEAYNGGVSLNHFSGTAKAHTHNGGISLSSSTGTLSVEAQNGGVSIKDCGGDVNATVQNGGMSISLPERWEGKGMEAHTHNGGLVVSVPGNISTGVEIVGSEHTPIMCKGDVCQGAQRTWDDGRKILRFGSGDPQVRATTVNGGIVVKRRERSRAEL